MLELKVNGKSHSLEVPEDAPLLWVLRENLGLTGTKFGCGEQLCGACTVLVDGVADRACGLSVGDVAGQEITTIEGLGGEALHPLQAAWVELSVPQCGYCQPGQLMSAAALLAEKPAPTDDDIRGAMEGNLCRCGTYPRVRAAIHRAAKRAAKRKKGGAS